MDIYSSVYSGGTLGIWPNLRTQSVAVSYSNSDAGYHVSVEGHWK